MRWDRLFEDIEAQAALERADELTAEADERTRAERAATPLFARLRARMGQTVTLTLRNGRRTSGILGAVGDGWLMLGEREDGLGYAIVTAHGIGAVEDLPFRVAAEEGRVLTRLGLGYALRTASRDRSPITLVAEHAEYTGVIRAVGADHVDLALAAGRDVRTSARAASIPYAAVWAVIA